jgi:endonuclease/exonuclease/phosphatase family metal-dependent hydrolase
MEETNTHTEPEVKIVPPAPKKRSWWHRFVLWINYAVIICLLLSYLAPYVSPFIFWPLAFFGIAYPIFLILNLLFVIYWLILWRMRFLYSFITILVGINMLFGYVQFNLKKTPDSAIRAKHKLKFMSFNTKLFDLYNWSHNLETRSKIFDLLKSESPDIICMQEFYTSDKGPMQNLDTLVKFQRAKFFHSEYMVTLRGTDHWGMATFSSYPIVNRGHIDFNVQGNNGCIYTDIKIDEDTIRVYNTHLQSMHFSYRDYKYVESVLDAKELGEMNASRTILRRLKWAFRRRAGQADIISEHIRACRYPVIVCGDFNDTPASYTYHTLSKGMKDAFLESGNGFGQTYYGKFPSFRIDYVLHSKSILSWDFRTIISDLSDHYPVCCSIALKK